MPVRKNAKFLSTTERENFVKACQEAKPVVEAIRATQA